MKSFEDYIVEYPNVIDPELCRSIIDKFDGDDRAYQGLSAVGVDTNVKDSMDLCISRYDDWKDIDSQIFEKTTGYFSEYLDNYVASTNGIYPNLFNDLGYQVQKTTPGGQYTWHSDAMNNPLMNTFHMDGSGFYTQWIQERVFTFILYLNDRSEGEDSDNGRTQFYNCGISKSITPEAGKLLLFPSSHFWIHRGEPLTTGVKYLLTGWCCGYTPTRIGTASASDMDTIHSYIKEGSQL